MLFSHIYYPILLLYTYSNYNKYTLHHAIFKHKNYIVENTTWELS